jgi:hypothetical protein
MRHCQSHQVFGLELAETSLQAAGFAELGAGIGPA